MLKSKENCVVCGKPLIYATESEVRTCEFCGKTYSSQIYCPQGHYICDACHSSEAVDILKIVVSHSTSTDPLEILEAVISHPVVPMHGPEHHIIVPMVIVAATKNAGYPVPERWIDKVISRGEKVPGGWCGSHGACGAAVGVGIAVSVITGATPLKGKERSLAIQATALALTKIADNFPRCCKRSSRQALESAISFLRENLNINLRQKTPVGCRYSEHNQQCPGEKCSYNIRDK
jgi:7,8-dihydro-6-hydroxymethylpterin dimethyltransferase